LNINDDTFGKIIKNAGYDTEAVLLQPVYHVIKIEFTAQQIKLYTLEYVENEAVATTR
jgi:hypothetical protein